MSDCLLDFRPISLRRNSEATTWFHYFPDIRAECFEERYFSLLITRSDCFDTWGPYRDPETSTLVALVGRIAMEEAEWKASEPASNGGLACKIIFNQYKKHGVEALKRLNGNFVVVLYDPQKEKLHVVTDRCGVVPFFKTETKGSLIFSTHADLLARVSDIGSDFDNTSLAEFLLTGKVSFPFTYYRKINAVAPRSIYTIDLEQNDTTRSVNSTEYFPLQLKLEPSLSEWDLAEQLAGAFRNAVRRRVLSRFGRTTIALSGGLDSRMLLCACPEGTDVSAISFFDEENLEFETAKAIAAAKGISLTPIRRDPEHYGNAAERGVTIAGGMTSFASNHFLGFREQLRAAKAENLLTGCYCDYFFKALALNRKLNRFTRGESQGAFNFEYYRPLFRLSSVPGQQALERLNDIFEPRLRHNRSEEVLFDLEVRRLFPVSYEPDGAQRLVPQRVMPWYVPVVDNDVLEVYLSIPARFKFNASLFQKMTQRVCGPVVSRIPDSNTGSKVNASGPELLFRIYARGISNRFERKFRPRLATSGSWPNWEYYVHHSVVLRELWQRDQKPSAEFLSPLVGFDPFSRPIQSYSGRDVELFVRLLTLKIWFENCHQRLK